MTTSWHRLGVTLAVVIAVAASLVSAFLIGAGVTGHDRRSYSTVGASSEVTVAGIATGASDLATRYRPILRLDPDRATPPLVRTFYEVVDSGDDVTLLYHQVWADEVHPNRLADAAYRVYRAAVYGLPPRDVERTAITVSKADGAIKGVIFDGASGQPYDTAAPRHDVVELSRRTDGLYTETVDGVRSPAAIALPLEADRLALGNATWNHLSVLVTASMSEYAETPDVPLEELTDDLYGDGKYARKAPPGAITTAEALGDRAVATTITLAAALCGCAAWAPARRRRLS